MLRHSLVSILLLSGASVGLANDLESLLLNKFVKQQLVDVDHLRIVVNQAATQARDLKDIDPDAGLELLRAANDRIDAMRLLSYQERKAMGELVKPLVVELRDLSLIKKREKASRRLDFFKDYLVTSAYEGRYPARSGAEHWEPANFTTPAGNAETGKLYRLGTGAVTLKYGKEERNAVPLSLPWIQVFGGFYVYDKGNGHHIFLTNLEFYDNVWIRLAREFSQHGIRGKTRDSTSEFAQARENLLLQKTVLTGEYFLRSLPNLEIIPGAVGSEAEFLEFAAQQLVHKGLPVASDRIYPFDLQEKLVGFTMIQMSAIRRTILLLNFKGVTISPLFAEIQREETASFIRSEYENFFEGDMNRALLYVFSKLK